MSALRDLVFEVEDAAVAEAVGRLYDQRETEWLPDAIADVLTELGKLTPDSARTDYELHIELTAPSEGDE